MIDKHVLNIFTFTKFFPIIIVSRSFQIIMATVNGYGSTFAGYKIMSILTLYNFTTFFAADFVTYNAFHDNSFLYF